MIFRRTKKYEDVFRNCSELTLQSENKSLLISTNHLEHGKYLDEPVIKKKYQVLSDLSKRPENLLNPAPPNSQDPTAKLLLFAKTH
jgi:hypothetical protein